ncbi:MAG: NAD(P)-dependent oxidoreductase [Aestuariibacter sp.]
MYIPYIPNVIGERSAHWLRLFQKLMPEHQVSYLSDLPETEQANCEVAIVANPSLQQLTGLPNLKWLHSTWAGIEQVLPVARERGVPLVRMQDPKLAQVMAEAVLTWSLFLYRRIPCYQRQQRQRQWQQLALPDYQNFTIAILGMGNMGIASCLLLQQVGFRVVGWGRSAKEQMPCAYYYGREQLDEVLQTADIVVILLPLTQDTHHLLASEQVAKMKNGASIINFGRAAIVQYQALSTALTGGKLYHAVLDVFQQEPLSSESEEWQLPHATILPHVAAPTNPHTSAQIIADNIDAYCKHGVIPATVDLQKGY